MAHMRYINLIGCCILTTGMLYAELSVQRGTTQDLGKPGACTVDARHQVTTRPFTISKPARIKPKRMPFLRLPDPPQLIDAIEKNIFVLAGEEYSVRFDYRQAALTEISVPVTLTAAARDAVAMAPAWLQRDLEYSFGQLEEEDQDILADLLLTLDDPRTIDEVAFQIAHLSYRVLSHRNFEPELLEINAELMYTIDEDLHFVAIHDYDLGGGEFYSTTSYETLVNGIPTTVEIPRDIYYWYIVMPKVSDEMCLMDESVYNMFWREYLYYENDDGYPNLKEVMGPISYLWDGETHWWSHNDPFTDDMLAVHCVGHWCCRTVPVGASGNRPIQPNVIAHEHNGNCGEKQDILCAAARTCLMPYVSTMDINEDHVWCEMWWNGEWHPTQIDLDTWFDNPYISYEVDSGGSKECSCIWDWRNDGWTWDAIETYSQTCTLTVYIEDPNGVPVDNASVVIASEGWQTSDLYAGTWGETGQDGTIQFILGNNQDFYVQVTTQLGRYPQSGYAQLIDDSITGEDYYWQWTTPEPMTQMDVSEETPSGPGTEYILEVQYELPYDVQNGRDQYAIPNNYYTEKIEDGMLNFFIADYENYTTCQQGGSFTGYGLSEGSSHYVYFPVPSPEDFYIVLSGAEHHGLDTLANVSIRLWQSGPAEPDPAEIVTGPGRGMTNPPLVRTFDPLQTGTAQAEWLAYGVQKYGVNVACGDISADIMDEVITGPGPGAVFGPHVRAFSPSGDPLNEVSFISYGTRKYGVNIAAGDVDGDGFDEIVTGPGPGAVFGPHVRGWNVDHGPVSPVNAVSFMAYGTRRWGVNVTCGDVDGDGYEEIVTGAGPGAAFGPHVRGWDYDGGSKTVPLYQISFFAYGTPQWGVNVSCGFLDADIYEEILTGPGPGMEFGPHIRGWDYDDSSITPVAGVSFFAYSGYRYGVIPGSGDLDADGYDELLTMPGPGDDQPSEAKIWDVDGGPATLLGAFQAYGGMGFGFGGNIAGGFLYY